MQNRTQVFIWVLEKFTYLKEDSTQELHHHFNSQTYEVMNPKISTYSPKTMTLSTPMSLPNQVLLEISVQGISYEIMLPNMYHTAVIKTSNDFGGNLHAVDTIHSIPRFYNKVLKTMKKRGKILHTKISQENTKPWNYMLGGISYNP